ncbi:hypothetical protein ATHL_01696 [Anaerolinea thermolimosa]|uniref:DUF6259 domain-containing protein n=1 Tax=Anaerolinea thermolimosa TaxID=229919 RepID=UPI000785AF15|nr:DUF6259 domain-containing protein [Anaerolinea thermolimosa]GAP06833.1 hypothetical protein ATHL_01696 [Anaerolinea thermolimosa]
MHRLRWIAGALVGGILVALLVVVVFGVLRARRMEETKTPGPARTPSPLVLDNATENTLRLQTRDGELIFDQTNGNLLAVIERSSGEKLIFSSEQGALWRLAFNYSAQTVASTDYSMTGTRSFRYQWLSEKNELLLQYVPDPATEKGISVEVRVKPVGESQFDLQLTLQNHQGYEVTEVRFPDGWMGSRESIREVLLPIMPGVILNQGFFAQGGRDAVVVYPGWPGVFADFTGIRSAGGQVVLYTTPANPPLTPITYGVKLNGCPDQTSICWMHVFKPRISPEKTWVSPVLHIRIGGSWEEAADAYRKDSGLERVKSLGEKLGPLFEKVSRAPLLKADASQLGLSFADYPALLDRLPGAGLIHLVGYGEGGFDRNYPDFLPPDSHFGTTEDLARVAAEIRARGLLLMPYTNPTWWDGKSPTMRTLPKEVRLLDVVVVNDQGMHLEECYGCPADPHYGYVVSPYATFVQERLKQLMDDFSTLKIADILFEEGGFDRNYPDFLPPDSHFGTTEDLARVAAEIRARGLLLMPYTNPTWWDGKSPTMRTLPKEVRLLDVVVVNDQGMHLEECYGCPADPHYGYVVSPYATFVQERLKQLMDDFSTLKIADILFEDQIGARAAVYDYNKAAPSPDSYLQGWIEHTRTFEEMHLATEGGFDQLVETEVGFHGSVMLSERRGETSSWWGEGNWRYYPFVTQVARDRVFFYQHNLAPETFTHNKATLGWNAAMGYQLSYDLFRSQYGGGIDDEMLEVVAAFQFRAFASYAGERVRGYTSLNDNVTQTDFETATVFYNWDASKTYSLGEYSVPGNGFLLLKKDGSLVAGVFNRYNDEMLSPGEHYIIEERGRDAISIYQPKGKDTPLRIKPLPAWVNEQNLLIQAFSPDGRMLQQKEVPVAGEFITLDYQRKLGDEKVAWYLIVAQ